MSSISNKSHLKIPCRLHAPLNQMQGVVWNTQQQIQQFSFKKCGCTVRDVHPLFIYHPKPWSAIFTKHLDLMVQAAPFQNTLSSSSRRLHHVFKGKMFCQDKLCAQCIEVFSFDVICCKSSIARCQTCQKWLCALKLPKHDHYVNFHGDGHLIRVNNFFWKKGKKEHVHWNLHMCL